jgi:prepilin-type N-terminal cleavage/methylation domain-containing protein
VLIQPRSEADHKNIIEKGFTLVELLIVIVILGILAGIVVFAVGNLTQDAGKNACKTEVDTTKTAAEAFKVRALRYPQNWSEMTSTNTITPPGVTIEAVLKSQPSKLGSGAEQFAVTFDADATPGQTFVVTPGASCT